MLLLHFLLILLHTHLFTLRPVWWGKQYALCIPSPVIEESCILIIPIIKRVTESLIFLFTIETNNALFKHLLLILGSTSLAAIGGTLGVILQLLVNSVIPLVTLSLVLDFALELIHNVRKVSSVDPLLVAIGVSNGRIAHRVFLVHRLLGTLCV